MGATAQFAPTIENIEGAPGSYDNAYAYLMWWNRGGIIVERIPAYDHRQVAVGEITGHEDQLVFRPVGHNGATLDPPVVITPSVPLVVWLRVTLHGDSPGVAFRRRIGVTIAADVKRDGLFNVRVGLADDPPDAIERRPDTSSVVLGQAERAT